MQKLKVGISACLLGQPVRFNGTHKYAPFCSEVLSEWFDFVPICPELEIGLGVPREPIQLVNEINQIRVKNVTDQSRDYTDQLYALADQKAVELKNLCGYIFMQNSPSCGVFNVKVYKPDGQLESQSAMGAFAYQLAQNYPLLPIEEAGRINDMSDCENFMIRVFANHDWRQHVLDEPSAKKMVAFHSRYQLLLQAHSEVQFRQLGKIVADADFKPLQEILNQYFSLFSACLNQVAKINNHVKVMLNILKDLKTQLPAEVMQSMLNLIKSYKAKKVQLMVPITLLNYYVGIYKIEPLMQQQYLSPVPYQIAMSHNI